MQTFTYRSARSGSLVAGLSLAIVVETAVLHLALAARHPWLAWTLSASSVGALLWLLADYRALGRGGIRRDAGGALDLRIGRRATARLAPGDVASAERATWRLVPATGTAAGADYLNLTKPAQPNVLLTLSAPAVVRLPGGIRRSARRLGLHLDAPDAFIAAVLDTPDA